jgi:hypothetical protein
MVGVAVLVCFTGRIDMASSRVFMLGADYSSARVGREIQRRHNALFTKENATSRKLIARGIEKLASSASKSWLRLAPINQRI